MIREDRELLAELARLNTDVVPLAMRMMENGATVEEQRTFAERLIELGERLRRRADEVEMVVEGETVPSQNGQGKGPPPKEPPPGKHGKK